MQKSGVSILELNEKNILSFASYLPEDRLEDIRKREVGGFGLVMDDSLACGALLYSLHHAERTGILESICVDRTLRGKGLGRMLDEKFEQKARESGMKEAGVRVYLPLEEDAEAFFEAVGYEHSEPHEFFCEFRSADIMAWLVSPGSGKPRREEKTDSLRITSVAKLPKKRKAALPEIPCDEELSFAAFDGSTLKACILAAGDDEGNVVVLQIKAEDQELTHLFPLLEQAFHAYLNVIADGGVMYLSLSLPEEQALADLLAKRKDISYSYSLNMAKTLTQEIPETFEIPYRAFLIPRINGISRMLSDFGEGYEHAVAAGADEVSIELIRGKEKQRVSLSYTLSDPENAFGYVLRIRSFIRQDLLNEEEKEKVERWRKESTMLSFSEDDRGELVPSVAMVEEEGLTDPVLLKEALDGFILELDHFESLDSIGKA